MHFKRLSEFKKKLRLRFIEADKRKKRIRLRFKKLSDFIIKKKLHISFVASLIFFGLITIISYLSNSNGNIENTHIIVAISPFIFWLILSGKIRHISYGNFEMALIEESKSTLQEKLEKCNLIDVPETAPLDGESTGHEYRFRGDKFYRYEAYLIPIYKSKDYFKKERIDLNFHYEMLPYINLRSKTSVPLC